MSVACYYAGNFTNAWVQIIIELVQRYPGLERLIQEEAGLSEKLREAFATITNFGIRQTWSDRCITRLSEIESNTWGVMKLFSDSAKDPRIKAIFDTLKDATMLTRARQFGVAPRICESAC